MAVPEGRKLTADVVGLLFMDVFLVVAAVVTLTSLNYQQTAGSIAFVIAFVVFLLGFGAGVAYFLVNAIERRFALQRKELEVRLKQLEAKFDAKLDGVNNTVRNIDRSVFLAGNSVTTRVYRLERDAKKRKKAAKAAKRPPSLIGRLRKMLTSK